MTATSATLDAALKSLYRDKNIEKSTLKNRPMMGILQKDEGFTGRNMPMVNVYGNPVGGRSNTFSEAQGNMTSTKVEDFLLDITSNYALSAVTGDVADRTKSDAGAFFKAISATIDYTLDALADSLETQIPRSGTGTIGQVSAGSTVGSDTITLADLSDAPNFEVGMTLRGTSTDGGAYDTGEEVLEGINRSTGELTATSAAWNTVMTNLAAGDYLVVSGDAQNGGSAVAILGFQAWLPSTAPSGGESFFGVDRSVDSRLYGQYHDGSGQTVEDALIDAQSLSAAQGGVPTVAILNHVKMRLFTKQLGARKVHADVNATGAKGLVANVSYRGVCLAGDVGDVKVVAANKCPSADAFVLEQHNWKLFSIGKAVQIDDLDGNRMLRQASADGIEIRTKSRSNVACKNPIGSVRVNLGS